MKNRFENSFFADWCDFVLRPLIQLEEVNVYHAACAQSPKGREEDRSEIGLLAIDCSLLLGTADEELAWVMQPGFPRAARGEEL